MDFRLTYLDYAQLIGDRRPQKHSPPTPVRRPGNLGGWRR
jgi:hypothetical protein